MRPAQPTNRTVTERIGRGRAPWARRRASPRLALLAVLVVVSLSVANASVAAEGSDPSMATRDNPCGITSARPHYTHVVWILLENVGYEVIGSPSAKYLNGLAARCGLATDDFAITHPSLPNYIALTSGTTSGIHDDGEPSEHPLSGPSIFSQLRGDWRALEESMPTPCDRVTSGEYAARHNPAVYYTSLDSACSADDVPLTWPLDLGAAFTFITPNICDDMHSCPVATGDAWLARAVPAITGSAEYKSRSLVLFITFDENDSGPANRVPTIVVAPSVPRGVRVDTPLSHYSLLRTTESLLGLPLLAGARHAASMVRSFNL